VREKSSNLVDVWAESAAKHGPPVCIARATQKASCRRPLKREMIFSWIRHFALACCSRMILSENRHPSRIKFGTGFFRIMLWRERHNAAFTINEEQSAVALIAAEARSARQ